MSYRIAKGVFDLLPQEPDPKAPWRHIHYWQYVESVIRDLATRFGFREIRTPLFETTELFQRSIGTTTDIVTKEMYTFHDRAERSLTLRPEGTAPVMRAFIEKKLDPRQKLFYLCPMFRYERQQAGRYRQHHQFGVEAIGSDSPCQDVEVMDLLYSLLKALGLKGLTLQINSIGTEETRKAFRHALKMFLKPHLPELSEDSQARYESNPLRILDSKASQDKRVLEGAPSILDFLDEEGKIKFEAVCRHLEALKIPYQINSKLVRGLDYYCHTVFEITSDELGAQNSLGGGGRYDGLIKQLGGPDLPACGFGTGLERIIQVMLAQGVDLPKPPVSKVYFIPMGDQATTVCMQLVRELREAQISAEMDFSEKKLSKSMKYAHTIGAQYTSVIGDDELASGQIELKEMTSGECEKIPLNGLVKRLKG